MHLFYLIIIIFLILFCYKTTDKNFKDNLLINKNVFCGYLITNENLQNPFFKNKIYIDSIFSYIKKRGTHINLYNSSYPYQTYVKLTNQEKIKQLIYLDTKIKNNDGIFFYEEWYWDTLNNNSFLKNVLFYSPVIYDYHKNSLKDIFRIKNYKTTSKKNKKICFNISYEFNLSDSIFILNSNLDVKNFVLKIAEVALSNKCTVYNPFTLKPVEKKELKKILRTFNNKVILENLPISSLIFTERWFFDTTNLTILKDVIALSPILTEINQFNDTIKKPLFLLFLNKHKPFKIF